MQENHDEDKSIKPWLLIILALRIARQELFDIPED